VSASEAATRTERFVSKGQLDDWMTDTIGDLRTFAVLRAKVYNANVVAGSRNIRRRNAP
jgi:hypothetical protein